jgi:hypothetical protein
MTRMTHLGSVSARASACGDHINSSRALPTSFMRQRAVDLPFLHSGRRRNGVQSTAAYSFKLSASAVGYLGVTQTKENDREAYDNSIGLCVGALKHLCICIRPRSSSWVPPRPARPPRPPRYGRQFRPDDGSEQQRRPGWRRRPRYLQTLRVSAAFLRGIFIRSSPSALLDCAQFEVRHSAIRQYSLLCGSSRQNAAAESPRPGAA